MLPRPARLLSDRDFQKIYKRGRRATTPHLRVFYLLSPGTVSRFGLVVPTREVKSIARRNRLKRVLRAGLRGLLPKIGPGYEVILLARGGLLRSSPAGIQEELRSALAKTGVLKQ